MSRGASPNTITSPKTPIQTVLVKELQAELKSEKEKNQDLYERFMCNLEENKQAVKTIRDY